MSLISTLWKCIFSPRLYKFYEVSWVGRLIDKPYEAKGLERWGDHVVITFVTAWSFTIYAIPLIVIVLFRRGSPLADAYTITQFVTGASILLATSLMARGYSRAKNPTYLKFMKVLDKTKSHYPNIKQELGKYDFEFWAWPIDFDVSSSDKSKYKRKLTLQNLDSSSRAMSPRRRDSILTVPCKILSYGIAHTVALKLIYPGSISLVNWIMSGMLLQGRIDLIKIGAERFKLLTADNNEIDAIFLDRRYKNTNGTTLVITCEGNCGFYEIGIITTPLNKGYSVLGWNHPGFEGSTGLPFPDQEENAIDCVMKFAINKLGFPENKIILNGWSIGGYTASWAAMNYPYIHSLLLDATFDDILPLALARMPTSIEPLVRNVIRNYFNLNISAQLNRYDGRVLIIRRTDDEMICVPDNCLAGNRSNKLLEKLLSRRYPNLFANSTDSFTLLSNFLAAPTYAARQLIVDDIGVDQSRCINLIATDILDNNSIVKYPSKLGRDCNYKTKQQLVIYLATMYMDEQNSQHCIPLTSELFRSGWDPMSTIKITNKETDDFC
ncbi:PREDICTED: abhydrolase domain-containing protein 16A [Ceratosolen solmsi marchali]|uniref:Abhydrolase domain-containing protein 16A n=1 Tax=Ceratosolen solmsi marchali TaxID=326594 RepID=A0AAJ6VN13_9HYME|nr:PREDICTED: abhydrolase domain-containing protein 16A [Ceratosolen solmsi marchali]